MKNYIIPILAILLLITPVFGATQHPFEVNEGKLETLEIPVGDAVFFTYLDIEVRISLLIVPQLLAIFSISF